MSVWVGGCGHFFEAVIAKRAADGMGSTPFPRTVELRP